MKPIRTISDLLPTRRELLRFGGLGLAAASAETFGPLRFRASAASKKVTPRGTAKNVVFYEISGAISHLESFDFKESPGNPKDIQVTKLSTGIQFPTNFFPNLTRVMDRVAIVRSLVSHEAVHLRVRY